MRKVLLAMVLALATAGFGVRANAQTAPSDQSGATQAQPGDGQPGGHRFGHQLTAEERLQHLTKYLNLTDEQQQKILPILQNETQEMQAVRSDTSIQPDQRWPKAQAIMENTRSQIKPLLTADQQQKYEQMTTRRPPPGQGPGMNGGPGSNSGQAPPPAPPQ